MKFSVSVHSDDGTQIDYSVNLLSAANAVSFINGWQAQQEAAQQSVKLDEVPAWLCDCGRKHIKVHYGFTCLCGAVLRR